MSEVAIILILIIISFCCGIISSLISSGVVFMGDFDFDFASLASMEDPSSFCKIRFNQGSCADKGDQSSVLTATSGNPIDVNLDEGGLDNWGDQDGDSMDIKGNCSNIKIFDVNGEPLEISTYYSQNWKCTDFSSDMQDDVERVQFQMGSEMSADEFSSMTNITPCEIKINNGTCSNKGTQSVIMSAMPEDGVVQYDLDNNGLSGWSDQNGESMEIKGNCKNITIHDVNAAPLRIGQHISQNWECINFSDDLQDDLGIVSFENGTPPPPEPPPLPPPGSPPGTPPPPPPPPQPTQCRVVLKNSDCGGSGEESSEISNDGVYDIDNNGLSGWGDQDGESIMFKGDCKYIRVDDVESDEPSLTITNKHNMGWDCINFSTVSGDDLWDDVGNVTIQTGF